MDPIATVSIMIYACPAYQWSLIGIIFLYKKYSRKKVGNFGV